MRKRKRKQTGVGSLGKRLRGLGYRNYQEYLGGTHWKELKSRFYNSWHVTRATDGKLCCAACGKTGLSFSVHHRTYKRLGCEWLMDLALMCSDCHKATHSFGHTGNLWRATEVVIKNSGRVPQPLPIMSRSFGPDDGQTLPWD